MITCEESQKSFSPYLDGTLTHAAGDALRQHLEACPVCRYRLEETRAVVRNLSLLSRPAPPANLSASIKDALIIERAARVASPPLTITERCVRWLQTRMMPYSVGAAYSLILFVAVFGALRQQLRVLSNLAAAAALDSAQPDTAAAPNAPGLYDVTRPLSPSLAVAARAPFTDESPTLNPRGALAALTLEPPSVGRPGDDDMIV
ncbi:MAG TPA: anti-sigma factor, partial [Pyrinomonadaceae bacterium]|nr:anti-sigma factor [Pyrinomonadaceae bacterium]